MSPVNVNLLHTIARGARVNVVTRILHYLFYVLVGRYNFVFIRLSDVVIAVLEAEQTLRWWRWQ